MHISPLLSSGIIKYFAVLDLIFRWFVSVASTSETGLDATTLLSLAISHRVKRHILE